MTDADEKLDLEANTLRLVFNFGSLQESAPGLPRVVRAEYAEKLVERLIAAEARLNRIKDGWASLYSGGITRVQFDELLAVALHR